jgi:sortase A
VRGNRGSVWLEWLLLLVGMICLGWWTTMTVHGWYFRSQQASLFERVTRTDAASSLPAVPAPFVSIAARPAAPDPAGLVGVLDVPRLGISTPIISGDDEQSLAVAAGHLADTPLPWEPGNSTVAAHRDGLFRPLQRVRRGDLVRMRTTRGDFDYTVRDMKIVDPDDLSVLRPGRTDSLTLITCYPFGYIGHAPQRFVVRAERVAAEAQPSAPPASVVTPTIVPARRAPAAAEKRITKTRPAKSATASTRVSSRQAHKRETVSPQRKNAEKSRRADRDASRQGGKDEQPSKKRKWYRLFL